MRFLAKCIVGLSLTSISSPTQASCLNEVVDFAKGICGEFQKITGTSTLVDANGKFTAEAKTLIGRWFAEVGISGTLQGKLIQQSFENVRHEDLAGVIEVDKDCRQAMAKEAIKQVCSQPDGSDDPNTACKSSAARTESFSYSDANWHSLPPKFYKDFDIRVVSTDRTGKSCVVQFRGAHGTPMGTAGTKDPVSKPRRLTVGGACQIADDLPGYPRISLTLESSTDNSCTINWAVFKK